LFAKYWEKFDRAANEAWCQELGKISDDLVNAKIRSVLERRKAWLLIGGPPCQAYSLAGRGRLQAIQKTAAFELASEEKHFLYRQFLRILAKHKPPVFVMENVKGLLSSVVGGGPIFKTDWQRIGLLLSATL
jgi:DNA (cytosine-5)-methyltransferase 1